MKRVMLLLLIFASLLIAQEPVDLDFIFDYTRPWGVLPREICWSPDESQLAVTWNIPYERNWEIWTIGIPNGQVTRETFLHGSSSDPGQYQPHDLVWHPNGAEIFFIYDHQIYHLQLGPENKIETLTRDSVKCANLTVSPDGKWLAYTANQRLMLMDLAHKKTREVHSHSLAHTPVPSESLCQYRCFWSPKGQRLAVIVTFTPDHPEQLATSNIRVFQISADTIHPLELPIKDQQALLRNIAWTQSGESFLIDGLSTDHSTRYITWIDPQEGKADTLYREYSNYWIPDFGQALYWISNQKKFLFGSVKNGYQHLYTLDLESELEYAVTRGKWDIQTYQLTRDRQNVYFSANKENPLHCNIYRVRLNDPKPEKISYKKGEHRLFLAPSGKKMVGIFSSTNTPPKLFYASTIPKSRMHPLVQKEFKLTRDYTFLQPQLDVQVNPGSVAPSGYKLWIPDQELTEHKFPLIVHLRNNPVRNNWDELSLFNYYLMQAGCVVLECGFSPLDKLQYNLNRDSTQSFFQSQLAEINRLIDQVRKKEFIDPVHTALYGNHYAGYLTTMALFTQNDQFCKGAVISAQLPGDYSALDLDRQVYTWLNANDPGSLSISPLRNYRKLTGELVFMQGAYSSVAPLLPTSQLVQRMIADQISVDLIVYPWEAARISSYRTRAHLFGKMADYLLTW